MPVARPEQVPFARSARENHDVRSSERWTTTTPHQRSPRGDPVYACRKVVHVM
jgi:hypothetical protein